MSKVRKRFLSMILSALMVLMMVPDFSGMQRAQAAEVIGDGIIISYDNGTTNGVRDYGFIFVPDVEGALPGMVLMHGGTKYDAPEDKAKNGYYGKTWMNDFIKKGNLQARIVVMPMVPNTSTTDINHQNYDYPNFLNHLFPTLLDRMEDGTMNQLIASELKKAGSSRNTRIDNTKKFVVSGYSLGGTASLYVGTKYRDRCPYIGALSPSERFVKWRTDVSPARWFGWITENNLMIKEDGYSVTNPEPKFYIPYADDSDRFLFLAQSVGEKSYFGCVPADNYWNIFAQKSGFVYCQFAAGGHDRTTQKRELFCFLYQLEKGKAPNLEQMLNACGTVENDAQNQRTYFPEGSVEIEESHYGEGGELQGTVRNNMKNPKVGDILEVFVDANCADDDLQRNWYTIEGTKETLVCTNKRYQIGSKHVGKTVVCRLRDKTGMHTGELVSYFEGEIRPADAPDVTSAPTTAPTVKPTATPTAKPTTAPTVSPSAVPALSGKLIPSQKNPKVGDILKVTLEGVNCESSDLQYRWFRVKGQTQDLVCNNSGYRVEEKAIGYNIVCKVVDKTGRHSGELTVTFEGVVEAAVQPTTVPTVKPTTAPTTKPTEDVTSIFADVPSGKWFVNAVQFVYERGIMNGKGEDPKGSGKLIFEPNANLTRAEFATVLYSMENKPAVAFSNEIKDVKNKSVWYAKPVHWVYEQNIASGYPNGNFGVADQITREQLALMLYKYAKLKGYKTSYNDNSLTKFGDSDMISSWAIEAMKWATSNGVMSGSAHEVPLLNPKGYATRSECAAMIKKLFENVK